jgi:RNA polymerase sigma-70 factor (ECF subfamily)
MGMDHEDDMDLAARVARGDNSALDQFCGRYGDLVFAFLYHQLHGARSDAEEVWQDTFVAALRALPGYRGQSRLSSWLCSIARRKVVDHLRRQNRAVGRVSALPPEKLVELMDRGPLPDDLLRQDATRACVVAALAELPADYREALLARYADGCSVAEVARRLGRSYKATESLLSRAKAMLRDVLTRGSEELE